MPARVRTLIRKGDIDKAQALNDIVEGLYLRIEALERRDSVLQGGLDAAAEAIAAIPGGAVTTLAAVGAAPNANAATLAVSTLNLEPASASYPGVVTTGNQTFAGIKTFGETHLTGIVKISSTNSIQFNNSSTYGIRYLFSPADHLSFTAPMFHFTGATESKFDALVNADKYGVITKDDKSASPGNFTTTRFAGRAAFAAAGTAVVITLTGLAATADCFVAFLDNDATLTQMKAVCTTNTITVTGNAAATAATKFSWFLVL